MKNNEWRDGLIKNDASSYPFIHVLKNKNPESPTIKDFLMVATVFLLITAISYIAFYVFSFFH